MNTATTLDKPEGPAGFAPATGSAPSVWIGKQVYVHFDNWGRFCETPIRPGEMSRTELATVLKETPRRYRVRFDEDWPRGSKGDLVLVPKWAMTLAPNAELADRSERFGSATG